MFIYGLIVFHSFFLIHVSAILVLRIRMRKVIQNMARRHVILAFDSLRHVFQRSEMMIM